MSKNKIAVSVLILIVILSAAIILIRGVVTSDRRIAVIYKNGEIVREINLDKVTEPIEFTVEGDNGERNTVRAERGRIRITEASCPDKICVNQGWIENAVVPIVCLPNKVTIELRGGTDNDVDGIAGVLYED